ncbi:MAG: LacI family DNA-binding transcriptional regulator [Verrucomicrobiota bacterium]
MVRLKDIAEKAGLSVMTISKALRDAPDISVNTKVRVKLLAEQMGYVPDSTAQGLRNRTSKLFGLVIPSLTNPIFSRMVGAIEERTRHFGYDLILAHTLNMVEREESSIRRLLSRRVDGLFISPVYRLAPSAPIYDELKRRGTPTVILGQCGPFCSQFTNVESDDVAGSHAATTHLIQLGHKRIAFFSGPLGSPWAHERLQGYRRALREADIEPNDRLVFNAGTTIDEGAKAATQMINESLDVTAVQAVNDLVAIGAANLFLNQGTRIPKDLSIVGFGNILASEYFRVPLTTLRQPKHRMGDAAMDCMIDLLQGKLPESKRLPADLVVRASTAIAPISSHPAHVLIQKTKPQMTL